ncbi:hypothetical protein KUCAC02_012617 [Chaenocephalus aceratus]|uniref:Uncharacterized protein n=1 Tax=Chaenocephalus aceratus TaxID=36190 RepID=A0ACB9XBS5_CHAAC|nr:hypothetical protein KUCAC02_012617 [Chaenocephalus aceratus]
MPERRPLLSMQPFLSVMHAKAHSTKCEIVWSGRNLEGAGSTAGEEVEMVNSFLSRCAITTKYMTKSDNTSGDNQSLQMSIEQLFLGLCQKKACLYRQTDSNKIRQLRRKRLREEKTKLLAAIRQYNTGQPPEEEVERRLSAEQQTTDSLIWPWEVQSHESVSILAQKKVFDAYMGKKRLVEERAIIVREMRQHCLYLISQADKIRMQMQHVSCGGHSDMTQEGRDGLASLLKKRLADVDTHIQHLSSAYSLAIGPNVPQWLDDSDISDDSEEDPDEDITHILPPP